MSVPSQHPSASTPADARAEEIERIARVVLAVLDAKGAQPPEERSRAARLRDFFLTNWPVTTLLLSVAALGIAAAVYGASPGYYFKQLAINDRELDAKERQFAYERGMAEKHIALGRALLDQGRFKDAGGAFTEALGFDKHSVEARLGKFKAEFFSPSSEKQFDPAVVEQRIATLFMNLGAGDVYDMSQMSDTQTFALLTNPGSRGVYDPHALTALGDLMFETGRDDEARFYYGRAIALRPELAHAHAGLAAIAFEENDFATAAEAMQKAHDLAPSHPDYRTNLAAALLYAGRHVDAIDHYQEIFKIDQEKLSPYLECALAFRMQGEFRQSFSTIEYALDFFDEALKLAKNSEAAWFFVINGSRYYLTSAEDKQGYAYRTAQLSAYLAGDMAAHKRLNEGGYEPELPVPQAIRSAILAEVTEVRQRQPAMSSALDAYLRESGFLDR